MFALLYAGSENIKKCVQNSKRNRKSGSITYETPFKIFVIIAKLFKTAAFLPGFMIKA